MHIFKLHIRKPVWKHWTLEYNVVLGIKTCDVLYVHWYILASIAEMSIFTCNTLLEKLLICICSCLMYKV